MVKQKQLDECQNEPSWRRDTIPSKPWRLSALTTHCKTRDLNAFQKTRRILTHAGEKNCFLTFMYFVRPSTSCTRPCTPSRSTRTVLRIEIFGDSRTRASRIRVMCRSREVVALCRDSLRICLNVQETSAPQVQSSCRRFTLTASRRRVHRRFEIISASAFSHPRPVPRCSLTRHHTILQVCCCCCFITVTAPTMYVPHVLTRKRERERERSP